MCEDSTIDVGTYSQSNTLKSVAGGRAITQGGSKQVISTKEKNFPYMPYRTPFQPSKSSIPLPYPNAKISSASRPGAWNFYGLGAAVS
jgi:hypothetical protein